MLPIIGSYLTILAWCLVVLSPVLIPAFITAFAGLRQWASARRSIQPAITNAAPAAAS